VVIGNTGAGKSSLVNYLHGCAFERVKATVRAALGRLSALSVP
jgi:putative ribosome biogenesis GTPase RsgA